MNNKIVHRPNMSCEHCVRTIERELLELDGMESANADLGSKSVDISWDDTLTWDDIKKLLVEINYPAAD